jgi:hypothetical protein
MKNAFRKYSQTDAEILASFYGRMALPKLAKKLGRSEDAVRSATRRRGIHIERSMTPWERIEEMFGVTADAIKSRIRNAGKDDDVIPHDRSGRFYIFYEADIIEWLRRGNVLTFDRAPMHPDIQRIYDAVRRNYYTWSELEQHDLILVPRHRRFGYVPRLRSHESFFRRDHIWEFWWRIGHNLPRTSHAYAEAVRLAWESTYARKTDIITLLNRSAMTEIAKQCEGTTRFAIRKDELRKYFDSVGRHELAKRFAERPIHYMELINELDREKRR